MSFVEPNPALRAQRKLLGDASKAIPSLLLLRVHISVNGVLMSDFRVYFLFLVFMMNQVVSGGLIIDISGVPGAAQSTWRFSGAAAVTAGNGFFESSGSLTFGDAWHNVGNYTTVNDFDLNDGSTVLSGNATVSVNSSTRNITLGYIDDDSSSGVNRDDFGIAVDGLNDLTFTMGDTISWIGEIITNIDIASFNEIPRPFSFSSSNFGDSATVDLTVNVSNDPSTNLITGVTIHDVSSELPNFLRIAEQIIDESGLEGHGHDTQPNNTSWLNAGNGYYSPTGPDLTNAEGVGAVITFDLGGQYDLTNLHVWNYNEFYGDPGFLGRGSKNVDVSFANNLGGSFLDAGSLILDKATGPGDTGTRYPISIPSARLIRFDILSNHGGDSEFVGLSEIQFFGEHTATESPVPEPSSFVLLSLFCIAGLVLKESTRRVTK